MLQDRLQMLQSEPNTTSTDFQAFNTSGSEGLAELVHWTFGILRRQYFVIIFVAALCLGMGIIYLSIATPIYTAKTSVYIDLHRSPMGQQVGIFGNDPIEIDSQIQIIKSRAIALSVIKKLQLSNESEFKSTGLSHGLVSHLLDFLLGATAPASTDADLQELDAKVAAFDSALTVDRVADSRVITISYNSTSPVLAAQIANAIANAYIADQLEAKYEANRLAGSWLQERQQQLREQSDAAQRAVESFKKQNNIVTADGKPIDDKQIADLNGRLVAARTQVSDIRARLSRLQTMIDLGPANANVDGEISELNSPIVLSLRQQYLELSRREAEWSARYGQNHLAVVNLRNRMQEIRQSMFDELRRATETAKNDYEIAKQRQSEIENQLSTAVAQSRSTNQAQVTLSGLESTAIGYRNLYDSFVQHYMGATQEATFPITEARVISPASIPLQKSKPKTLIVLALSIFGGIGIGCGLALLRDAMDRVFRTANQVETALQLPCIALVPLVNGDFGKQLPRKAALGINAGRDGPVSRDADVIWTVVNTPLSSFAESIRSIKLAVDLHLEGRACKVVGFTSTFPNEGKSTIAASLTQLIAQAGGRVLLVDCDLRNPTLSRLLAPNASIGVVDVVSRRHSIAEAILREPKTKMAILPAGKSIPLFLTSEILGGDAMIKLFEVLRENYDYIIVDLPPLTPIVDVRTSTRLVDSYVLTVEWGRTNVDAVEHALKGAPKIYDSLLGTVLNKTDMGSMRRYDNTGRYDYNKDFTRYGYID